VHREPDFLSTTGHADSGDQKTRLERPVESASRSGVSLPVITMPNCLTKNCWNE
jgi:hypothetical protein